MYTLRPTIAQLAVKGPPGEIQPRLVEIGERSIWTGHPNHHRRRVGDQTETLFALAYESFRLLFPRALPQQSDNQHGLNDYHSACRDDVFPMALPEGGFTVQDTSTRRQRRLRNVPSAKLSPIDGQLNMGVLHNGNVVCSLTGEHPCCELSRHHSIVRGVVGCGANGSAVQNGQDGIRGQALCDRSKDIKGSERS